MGSYALPLPAHKKDGCPLPKSLGTHVFLSLWGHMLYRYQPTKNMVALCQKVWAPLFFKFMGTYALTL
jgi:hypothetical protein